jgi:A/G-specific adenine glycosylase
MNPTRSLSLPLLSWFDLHGRHDLPWQHPRSPYRVWVSEIMLQQTQVTTVIPYFKAFIQSFPTVNDLATAPLDNVLSHWAGLGYYARARNLHKAAQIIIQQHQGEFPMDLQQLQALAGIGKSTAGAILAQGFNQRAVILDGNVKRILARYEAISGWPGKADTEKKLWQIAEQHTPYERVADYTQAIMDLGATVCKRMRPLCEICPLQSQCKAFLSNRTTELPIRKPSKRLPLVERYILVRISPDAEIYLERRPLSGIWGGLYSFPESVKNVSSEKAIREFNVKNSNSQLQLSSIVPIKHSFSHFRLLLKPVICRQPKPHIVEDQTGQWFTHPVTTVGLPAPIDKWLNSEEFMQLLCK